MQSNLKCALWKRFHFFLEKFGNIPMIPTAQCSFSEMILWGMIFIYFLSFSAEKLRLQEELFRMRSHRKDGEARKEHLLNRAKILQARATSHKQKVNYFFLNSYGVQIKRLMTKDLEVHCSLYAISTGYSL